MLLPYEWEQYFCNLSRNAFSSLTVRPKTLETLIQPNPLARSVCQHELMVSLTCCWAECGRGKRDFDYYKFRVEKKYISINQAADIPKCSCWAWTKGWCEQRHRLTCSSECGAVKTSRPRLLICSHVLFFLLYFGSGKANAFLTDLWEKSLLLSLLSSTILKSTLWLGREVLFNWWCAVPLLLNAR